MTHVNRVMIHWEHQVVEFGVVVQETATWEVEKWLLDTEIGRSLDLYNESLPYWSRRVDVTFIAQHPPITTCKLAEVIAWYKEANFQ